MKSFLEWIRDYTPPFSFDKFIEFLPELARAGVITVQVTLLAFLLAAVLGLLVALARMSGRRWLRISFTAYLEFIRNTPLLVQLYVAFWFCRSLASNCLLFSPGY